VCSSDLASAWGLPKPWPEKPSAQSSCRDNAPTNLVQFPDFPARLAICLRTTRQKFDCAPAESHCPELAQAAQRVCRRPPVAGWIGGNVSEPLPLIFGLSEAHRLSPPHLPQSASSRCRSPRSSPDVGRLLPRQGSERNLAPDGSSFPPAQFHVEHRGTLSPRCPA